jgi:hypothetical protein
MRPAPLIGIAGKARAGKNTLADFLQAQYGGYQYSFANPIRAMLKAGFGVDLDTDYWNAKKEEVIPAIGRSPRELMQTLGTQWGRRTVHPELWLILATGVLNARGPGMIVSDIRFENEAAWVRKLGGTVIHLYRDKAPQVAEHESENGVIVQPQDMQVYNNAGLEDLQFAVSRLFTP